MTDDGRHSEPETGEPAPCAKEVANQRPGAEVPQLWRKGRDMRSPGSGCSYQVEYRDQEGQRRVSGIFPDEAQFGRWFLAQEARGELDRTSPDDFTVYMITHDARDQIDIMHPWLVRGRLESDSE